jgi:undecaprenyl-diphosphatase
MPDRGLQRRWRVRRPVRDAGVRTAARSGTDNPAVPSQPSSAPDPVGPPARRRAAFRLDIAALFGFLVVFGLVRARRTEAFDLALTLRVQGRRSPAVGRLMAAVSWPGFPPQSRLIPPALAGALLLQGRRLEAAAQGAAWGTALLSTAVKEVTRRDRPLPPNVRVAVARLGGSSFPSGHVLTYVGVYGFAAHLANGLVGPRGLRAMAIAPFVALVALVGPSRIYQGHHWPTDVLASYLLGLAYLLGLTAVYDRLKRDGR